MAIGSSHGCLNDQIQHVEVNAKRQSYDTGNLRHDLVDR
jgi:hypothetical protein